MTTTPETDQIAGVDLVAFHPPTGDAAPIATATSETELAIPDGISFDEWVTIGRTVLSARAASDWWVGDWMASGWRQFATDENGVERSIDAARLRTTIASMTTLDLDLLRAARDTAEKVAPARRRRTLSFAHHQQVLALDDERADRLLDQAEQEGLEPADLKAEVRKAAAVEGGEAASDPVVKPARARLTITAGVGERDAGIVATAIAAAESAAVEALAAASLDATVTVS